VLNAGDIMGHVRRARLQVVRDSGWGTTLSFLVCLMLLTQMLFLFLLSVRAVGHLLTDSAALQLEVLPSAGEDDIQELYAALRVHPAVRTVTFLSKQQVYEQQKALHPDDIAFLEQYDFSNPFPDIFSVTLTSLDAYDQFAQDIRSDRWQAVVDPSFLASAGDHEKEVRTLLQVTDGVHTLSLLFTVIALAVLCCAVFEWAKRTADRRGHELMLRHLLGGSTPQVLLPFTAEMSVLLIISALLAALLVAAFVLLLPLMLPALALETPFRALQEVFSPMVRTALPLFLLVQILCMPVLAYAGTAVAARKSLPKSFTIFS
jgi:cell division protein FtsX